jgi:hypothetical protein
MTESAGNLSIGVTIDFSNLDKQLKKVQASTAKASSKIDANMKRGFDSIVRHAKRAAIGIGVAMAGITITSLKAASNAEEVQGKFDVVFKGMTKEAEAFSKSLAKSVGRSNTELKDMLAGLQDLFVPFGFTREAALELDKTLVTLAIDVASFNNKVDADVIRDFRAALTGSNETVQKYGVIINDNTLKQEALSQGITKSIKDLTLQEKALLKVSLIQKGSTDAMGDAIRTGGSFANQMKRLRSSLLTVQETIGKELLPEFNNMVKRINTFLEENPEQIKAWAKTFADEVTKVVNFAQKLFDKIGGLDGVFKALKASVLAISGILLVRFVAALVTAIASTITFTKNIFSNTAALTAEAKALAASNAQLIARSAIIAKERGFTAKGRIFQDASSGGITRTKSIAKDKALGGAGGAVAGAATTTLMFKLGFAIGKIGVALKGALLAAVKFGAWLLSLPVLLATIAIVGLAILTKKTREFSNEVNKVFTEQNLTQRDISERVAAPGRGAAFDKRVTEVKGSERFAATRQLQHEFGRRSAKIWDRADRGIITQIEGQKQINALEKEKQVARKGLQVRFGFGEFSPEKVKERQDAINKILEDRRIAQEKARKELMRQNLEIEKRVGLEKVSLALAGARMAIARGGALLGAVQAEGGRTFTGAGARGAVSISGQELFGAGEKRISKDAKAITDQIKILGTIFKEQTKEKDRLEKIDTGTPDLTAPAVPL